MGVKRLRRIQLGHESSAAGTEANATVLLRCMGTVQDDISLIFPDEDIGRLMGDDNRSYIDKYLSGLELDEMPMTFQEAGYFFESGIKSATAGADGGGSDYIYAYPFPTTAANTIKTYTVEGGDNQQEEQFLYGFTSGFTIKGAAGEAWMIQPTMVGRQLNTGTYTGSLTPQSVEECLFQKSKLYIDDTGGTIGSTQATTTFLSAEIKVDTGLRPQWYGDGSLDFSTAIQIGPSIEAKFTFEHDATAVTEKANWRAQTTQLVRVLIEGSSFGTPGTTYSVHTMIIDLVGRWHPFEKIGEKDGNDIVVGTLNVREGITDSVVPNITVVNELNGLT